MSAISLNQNHTIFALIYQFGSRKLRICLHAYKDSKEGSTKFKYFNYEEISPSSNTDTSTRNQKLKYDISPIGKTDKSLEETIQICHKVSEQFDFTSEHANSKDWCENVQSQLNIQEKANGEIYLLKVSSSPFDQLNFQPKFNKCLIQ